HLDSIGQRVEAVFEAASGLFVECDELCHSGLLPPFSGWMSSSRRHARDGGAPSAAPFRRRPEPSVSSEDHTLLLALATRECKTDPPRANSFPHGGSAQLRAPFGAPSFRAA